MAQSLQHHWRCPTRHQKHSRLAYTASLSCWPTSSSFLCCAYRHDRFMSEDRSSANSLYIKLLFTISRMPADKRSFWDSLCPTEGRAHAFETEDPYSLFLVLPHISSLVLLVTFTKGRLYNLATSDHQREKVIINQHSSLRKHTFPSQGGSLARHHTSPPPPLLPSHCILQGRRKLSSTSGGARHATRSIRGWNPQHVSLVGPLLPLLLRLSSLQWFVGRQIFCELPCISRIQAFP